MFLQKTVVRGVCGEQVSRIHLTVYKCIQRDRGRERERERQRETQRERDREEIDINKNNRLASKELKLTFEIL